MTSATRDPAISISVVSHAQGRIVEGLLADLCRHVSQPVEVLLTLNVPERLPFGARDYPFPLHIVENSAPKGFGANHNAAFGRARGELFCVLNPDIRLDMDPFAALRARIDADASLALCAPLIVTPAGAPEDSVRRFPTPWFILQKALGVAPNFDYPLTGDAIYPDWVAGMFILCRRAAFQALGGFDERYFMYYEDVDFCARAKLAGLRLAVFPGVRAIHDARRASRSSLRHLRWHLAGMLRFFLSAPAARLAWRGLTGSVER